MNLKHLVILVSVNAVIIGMILTIFASGAIVSSANVSSSGIVATANLRIYSDSACTQTITSIDWGTVSSGSSINKTVYIKNVGTAPLTLSLTKNNWNPTTANGPITLTWNREGTTLAVNQVSAATLTLGVSSGINGITSFSVNIVISGTG